MMLVTVVGAGPGDASLMTLAARDAIAQADAVIGAKRLIESDVVAQAALAAERFAEVRTGAIVELLRAHGEWNRVCIVMSGDIGLFSGAAALREALAAEPSVRVDEVPGISSAQLLAARLGRPWQGWRFESAHGVACGIEALAAQGGPLFLVTGGANTIASLCARLAAAGLGDATVSVGERLSYDDERITCGSAAELADGDFDPLAVMLVDPPRGGRLWPWRTGGIPDELFERGRSPMTKQEVRAVSLSKLRVGESDVVFDIGAGTGSVTVELALAAPRGTVYAIERDAEGIESTRRNIERFGLGNAVVVEGTAPAALEGLPAPDAVFVGGSGGGLKAILDSVLAANPAARVCVTCVTLETLSQASALLSDARFADFDAVSLSVARSSKAGAYHLMRALNPVHVLSARGAAAPSEGASHA
ncbi:MAG: precorrin-6Y C5,15-methyltransferase (decarboxylating) subunit CbiT [Eggerthellaceae bacterium]|nr:precorrin-6Y C5,15-methyltransferase (decarboxylating) subunit CbiT [Eggerthellaceae bacterium]